MRTALRPRWLALLVVVLAAASVMASLGNWQLSRARERSAEAVRERQQAPPRPLDSVLRARQTFTADLVDAPVVARGRWDDTRRLLVARAQDGVSGFWVLTPLVLADGSAVGVVRGWTDDASTAEALSRPVSSAPTSEREVRGVLRPAEPPAPRNPGDPDPAQTRQLESVDITALVKLWPYPLLTGYLISTDPISTAGGRLQPADTVDDEAGGLSLQNLSYALQWWVFAALGLFFWWRLVRDDARGELRPAGPAHSPVGDDVARPDRQSDQQPDHEPEQQKVEQR